MRIDSVNKTQFSGYKIANVNIKTDKVQDEYKIYKLTPKDSEFLENLYTSINLGRLYDDLTDIQYDVWDWVLEQGLCKSAMTGNYKSLLIADRENKPFGVLNYRTNEANGTLKYLCTWPVRRNEKKSLGGKALVMEMFRQLKDSTVEKLEVHALRNSVFNPIMKYKQMGFETLNDSKSNVKVMTITKEKMQEVFSKFQGKIQIIPTDKPHEVNLFDELTINRYA